MNHICHELHILSYKCAYFVSGTISSGFLSASEQYLAIIHTEIICRQTIRFDAIEREPTKPTHPTITDHVICFFAHVCEANGMKIYSSHVAIDISRSLMEMQFHLCLCFNISIRSAHRVESQTWSMSGIIAHDKWNHRWEKHVIFSQPTRACMGWEVTNVSVSYRFHWIIWFLWQNTQHLLRYILNVLMLTMHSVYE